MNIILVPPPHISHESNGVAPLYPPVGLISIATIAKKKGIDNIKIIDINWAKRDGLLCSKSKWHYQAAEFLLNNNPDVLGFSTLCSSFPSTILICKAVKEINKSITIVLGGPQASITHKELLSEITQIDFVLKGESDFTFSDFIKKINASENLHAVRGISYKYRNNVVSNNEVEIVNVNDLPFLDYNFWPIDKAMKKGFYSVGIPIEVGRGCPFDCIFCSTSLFFNRKFRMKSPTNIVSEILFLYKKFNISKFKFTHDLFTANKEKVLDICNEIKKNTQEITWSCSARIDKIDKDILASMKESGCNGIFYGIEVFSDRMQKIINKNINVDSIEPTLNDTLSLGFDFIMSFIIGFPQEEWCDIENTLKVILKWSGIKKVQPQLHILAPQLGTRIMDNYRDKLSFDGRFPDRAYFNKKCSSEEMKFAMNNLNLCPQFGFLHNPNVDRNTLIAVYELTYLLISTLPGLGKFITMLNISILELFNEWLSLCASNKLEAPCETGYFSMDNNHKTRYVYISILLDLILKKYLKKNVMLQHFVNFWLKIASLNIENNCHFNSSQSLSQKVEEEVDISMSATPILKGKYAIIKSEYDIENTLSTWRKKGAWEWPTKKEYLYFFVFLKREKIQIMKVSRCLSMIIDSCGKLNIKQMLFLIESLSDEQTINFKKSNSAYELLGFFIGFLKEKIGVEFCDYNLTDGKPF